MSPSLSPRLGRTRSQPNSYLHAGDRRDRHLLPDSRLRFKKVGQHAIRLPGWHCPCRTERRVAKSARFPRSEELLAGPRGAVQRKPRMGEGRMEERLQNTLTGRAGRGHQASTGVAGVHGGQRGQTTKGAFSWAPVGTQPRTQGLRCHPSSWPCHPHPAGPFASARHWTPQRSVSFTLYLTAWAELPSAFLSPHKTHGVLGVHPSPPPASSCPGTPASS